MNGVCFEISSLWLPLLPAGIGIEGVSFPVDEFLRDAIDVAIAKSKSEKAMPRASSILSNSLPPMASPYLSLSSKGGHNDKNPRIPSLGDLLGFCVR